jgi:hypothetical protein
MINYDGYAVVLKLCKCHNNHYWINKDIDRVDSDGNTLSHFHMSMDNCPICGNEAKINTALTDCYQYKIIRDYCRAKMTDDQIRVMAKITNNFSSELIDICLDYYYNRLEVA